MPGQSPSPDPRPTCSTCFFSKVKTVDDHSDFASSMQFPRIPAKVQRRFCLHDPIDRQKDDDDFCHMHPAWQEFELVNQGRAVSDFYETCVPL